MKTNVKENDIKIRVKEILIDVLQLENTTVDDIADDQLFFGDEEKQIIGLIQDSLAVLEIATRLADEYDLLPSEFTQESFKNVDTLGNMILIKLKEKLENDTPETTK
jgi:acyl carrier protein